MLAWGKQLWRSLVQWWWHLNGMEAVHITYLGSAMFSNGLTQDQEVAQFHFVCPTLAYEGDVNVVVAHVPGGDRNVWTVAKAQVAALVRKEKFDRARRSEKPDTTNTFYV